MNERIYPIGIQNFEKLRQGGYVYVDKTGLAYRMVKTGSYYFLSRPRRFGKSLLISTLLAYFEGKKELFVGLAMERLEKEWIKRPVLHLDLNIEKYDKPESLDNILDKVPDPMGKNVRGGTFRAFSLPAFRRYHPAGPRAKRPTCRHPCR